MRPRVTKGCGLPVLSLVLLLACSAAPAAEPANAKAGPLVREFFAADTPARRAEIARQFEAVSPRSWADLRMLLHEFPEREALKPGRLSFEAPAADGLPAVKYILRVPPGYRGNERAGWGLVIGCHALGGNPGAMISTIEKWLGPEVDRFLVAAPEDPQPGPYKVGREGTEFPLSVLYDLRHRANVDSNQVVLAGQSKGGYVTWGTALFSPGEWAGAVVISAIPLTEASIYGITLYLPNVTSLAIQDHWGATDIEPGQREGIATYGRDIVKEMKRLGAPKFEGIEYPGEGHSMNVRAADIRTFISTARRDPWPDQCHIIFHRLYQGRAYYVKALAAAKLEFDFKEKRQLRGINSQEEVPAAMTKLFLGAAYELSARLEPQTNSVLVYAKGISTVDVELPAEKLDYSRPIKVVLNSRLVSEETRKVDYLELLDTARRTGDLDRLVGGRVKASLGAAPVVPK